MAPKPNSNKWSDVQLAIAAISMTAVIGYWNMFAGPDRTKSDGKAAAEQQALLIPTVTPHRYRRTTCPSGHHAAGRVHHPLRRGGSTTASDRRTKTQRRWWQWERRFRWRRSRESTSDLHVFILMFHQISFRAMGSDMLAILEQDSESVPKILKDVPTWFEEWEQALSRFRLDSELSQLNRTFDQPVAVSHALWDVFQTAVWADEFSEGLVTPTILDAMLEAGYDRSFDDLLRDQFGMAPQILENHLLSMVVADSQNKTITLPQGTRLDFGGVAKGWAAHQTVERLREYGPCLMNAGGDIAVSGPRMDGSPWQIGVSSPFEAKTDFDTLHMKQGGVASSGKDRRHWKRNGQFLHHIINPNTGLPIDTDVLRVTVVAPTVMEAEAAAKTAFILGKEQGLEWIESHSSCAGLMIMESGEVFISPSMPEYLQGVMYATSK